MEGTEYSIKIVLVVPCAACGARRTPSGPGVCRACSAQLPADEVSRVRAAIRERRQLFKGRLSRLDERMREKERDARFATRGTPLEAVDHLRKVLRPYMDAITPGERSSRDC